MDPIDDKLRADLALIFCCKTDLVIPEMEFSEKTGLQLDSFAVVSLIALFDERDGIVLDGGALSKCLKVGDVLDLVHKEISR